MNPIRLIQFTCAAILLGIPLALGCSDAYGCPPQLQFQQFNAGHCQAQQVQQFVQPQAYSPQYVQPFVQQQVYAAPLVQRQVIVQRQIVPHVQRQQIVVQQVKQHHAPIVQQVQVQAIRQRAVIAPRVQVQRSRTVTRIR